jgi:hypothetical protein
MTIDKIGTKRWRNKRGKLHRLDGPAVEFANGDEEWHKNGLLHRLDGPAYITADGHKEWFFEGLLHREDGPAVIYSDGTKKWWLKNVLYKTKESYFDALSDEAKEKCLFSEDFLNG